MITDSGMTYLTNACGEDTGNGDISRAEEAWLKAQYAARWCLGNVYYVQLPDGRRGLLVQEEFWHTDTGDELELKELHEISTARGVDFPDAIGALRQAIRHAEEIVPKIPGSEPFVAVVSGPFERHCSGAFLERKAERRHFRFTVQISGVAEDRETAWKKAVRIFSEEPGDPPDNGDDARTFEEVPADHSGSAQQEQD